LKFYVLVDPQSLKVRYVGVTAQSLEQRLFGHLNGARYRRNKSMRAEWIRSLVHEGYCPLIRLLGYFPEHSWRFWESHLIELYRKLGYKLVNGDSGGGGFSGRKSRRLKWWNKRS
jgi:hypothetical protein